MDLFICCKLLDILGPDLFDPQKKNIFSPESLIINTVWLKAWLECGGGGKWPLQSLTTNQPCSRSILCCCIFSFNFVLLHIFSDFDDYKFQ